MVMTERREGTPSVSSNESQPPTLPEPPITTNESNKSVIKIVHQNVARPVDRRDCLLAPRLLLNTVGIEVTVAVVT